jgi:hypothetical protein
MSTVNPTAKLPNDILRLQFVTIGSIATGHRAGQAVRYFPRYSCGWPQSPGRVELPLAAAAQAWPYLTYRSLVTVSP